MLPAQVRAQRLGQIARQWPWVAPLAKAGQEGYQEFLQVLAKPCHARWPFNTD